MLPQFSLLLLLSLPFSSGSIAKPGCPDRCGNLPVPFPFGIGSGCYLAPSFEITCNTSADPPTPFLPDIKSEIVELYPTRIRIQFPNLALTAYNQTRTEIATVIYDLSQSQYTFSYDSWVTAVGCDDALAVTGQANRSFFAGGCVAFCRDRNGSGGVASCPIDGDGNALGIGCCRTPIPRGTTNLAINISDASGNWRRQKLYPSSYAFVGEKGNSTTQSRFSYRLNDLDKSKSLFFANNWAARNTPPVVLDWRIGVENCDQARRNRTTFACHNNSICSDFDINVGGYLCNCTQGYEGNPYLSPGCIDVDECGNSPCSLNSDCINTPGSFECRCHRGYYGDGTSSGTGCSRVPQSKAITNISIGLGSGFGFLLLLAILFWLRKVLQKRKKRMQKEELFRHLLLQHQTNEDTLRNTKLFPAKELEKATDQFNESRILGQGGQGIVYKGMLPDGKIVAIKKLRHLDDDQLEQFINEIVILSQINHRNVVKLLGCCLETEVPLLVYEFLPNGTLFDLIHGPRSENWLSWDDRLRIAADVAGALAYLHSASAVPIYHRDVKSSNILLDEKYVVKVSDFGTSKSVELDRTHVTTLVKGTFGYLDPEYFQTSQFTDKSDVYSFGVVVVELLTGERPISMSRVDEERNLATRFVAAMEAEDLGSILDARVCGEGRREEVFGVGRLAQRCLNLRGKLRPTMKDVATELESFRMNEMASSVEDESKGVKVYEAKPMMISDFEYTWTNSSVGDPSTPSDTQPFKIEIGKM